MLQEQLDGFFSPPSFFFFFSSYLSYVEACHGGMLTPWGIKKWLRWLIENSHGPLSWFIHAGHFLYSTELTLNFPGSRMSNIIVSAAGLSDKLEGGIFNNTSNSAKFACARGILRPVLHRLNGILSFYWMSERRDGGKRYWVKCKEAGRRMHMSVWIPICLRRAVSGRVYQSSPIIYIQRLISLHLNWQRERVCSSELGRVTVEKLSVQAKYTAILMYTLGVSVRSEGLGINARVLLAAAVTDAISVSFLEGRGF